MNKKYIFLCCLFFSFKLFAATIVPQGKELLDSFLNTIEMKKEVPEKSLQQPYNYLLTQPLMTLAIETYYKSQPVVQVIFSKLDSQKNIYTRIIIMLVDRNQNKPTEKLPVELALIQINFNELPELLVQDVLHTSIPFGKLLVKYQVETSSVNRQYFSIQCTALLESLINCKLNSSLYGRNNTIIKNSNKHWIAKVVEILP